MTLEELVVKIVLDVTGFTSGQKAATAAASKMADDVTASATRGEKGQTEAHKHVASSADAMAKGIVAANTRAIQSVEGTIRSFLTLFGILTGTRSLTNFVEQMIGLDATVGRLGHNVGSTAETISSIGRAVERAGGSFDGAASGIQSFSDAFQDLRTTGQSSIMEPLAKLQAMGGKPITIGKDWHKSLLQIGDDLQALDKKDPALADYLGRQVLHDPNLVNWAKRGSAAMLADEDKSPKITKEQAELAKQLQERIVALKQSFQDTGNAILMDFGPAMLSGLRWIKDLIDANRGLIETKVKEWVQEVGAWFKAHKEDIVAFGNAIGAVAAAFAGVVAAVSGQSPLAVAFEAFGALLALRILAPLASILSTMRLIGGLPLTGALSLLTGVGGIAAAAVVASTSPLNAGEPQVRSDGTMAYPDGHTEKGHVWDGHTTAQAPKDERNWWQRTMPKVVGGQDAPIVAHGAHGASVSDRGARVSKGPTGVPYEAKSATEAMGVTPKEWDAFREGVTDIEGKRYDRMGGAGHRFAGRYQMGGAEITDTARRLGVDRPSNEKFLSDPAMQEKFFENYTVDHYNTLKKNPKFAAMAPREQLKILGYAHNQGTGGPTRENGAWGYVDSGKTGSDAFGTSGTAYFPPIARRLAESDRASTPSDTRVGDAAYFDAQQRQQAGKPRSGDPALVSEYRHQHATPDTSKVAAESPGATKPVTAPRDPQPAPKSAFGLISPAEAKEAPYHPPIQDDRSTRARSAAPPVDVTRVAPVVPLVPRETSAQTPGITAPKPALVHSAAPVPSATADYGREHNAGRPQVPNMTGSAPMLPAGRMLTLDDAANHVLKTMKGANDNQHPVKVDLTEGSATKIGAAGKSGMDMLIARHSGALRTHVGAELKKSGAEMDRAFSKAWTGLGHHAGIGAGEQAWQAVNHAHHQTTTHHVDNSSATKVGTINVHTAATDAKGIAADIEPHLARGQAAGRGNYGLA